MAEQSASTEPTQRRSQADLDRRGLEILEEGALAAEERARLAQEQLRATQQRAREAQERQEEISKARGKVKQELIELDARIREEDRRQEVLDRSNACIGTMKSWLTEYSKTHTKEETQAAGKPVYDEYLKFKQDPSKQCPVTVNPQGQYEVHVPAKTSAVELHPEVMLAEAQTGAPLDTALRAMKAAGVRIAA